MNARDEAEAKRQRERCCANCVFGERLRTRWLRVILTRWPGLLVCFHKAGADGELSEVIATGTCRNFVARPDRGGQVESVHSRGATVRYIRLTRGKHAIVDAADDPALARHKWQAQVRRDGRTCYAVRASGRQTVMMHREIMKPPKGMVVDHINGNGLDNRRCNLRICTQAQNMQNKRIGPIGRSRFRGVSPLGDKWQATVRYRGRNNYVGLFDDEVEAAKARDRKAFELAGEFAVLNFPEEVRRRP